MHAGVSEKGGDLVALPTPPVATAGALKSSEIAHNKEKAGEVGVEVSRKASVALLATGATVQAINLSGVMGAVERVYDRRKALSLKQMESKTVVAQVCLWAL